MIFFTLDAMSDMMRYFS